MKYTFKPDPKQLECGCWHKCECGDPNAALIAQLTKVASENAELANNRMAIIIDLKLKIKQLEYKLEAML